MTTSYYQTYTFIPIAKQKIAHVHGLLRKKLALRYFLDSSYQSITEIQNESLYMQYFLILHLSYELFIS